jgi:hypothetical protein
MSGSKNPGSRLARIRNSKFRAWTWYSVIIPTFAVAVCWPIARWLYNVNYAFEKNFVSGDLLLLGALLFIGIAVEIHSERKDTSDLEIVDPNDRLDKLYHQSQFLAFLFGAAFWVVKLKSINYDFPAPGGNVPLEINIAVGASIVGGIVAILCAYGAFRKVYKIFLSAEIRELAISTGQRVRTP